MARLGLQCVIYKTDNWEGMKGRAYFTPGYTGDLPGWW